jgi:hypothetical protein
MPTGDAGPARPASARHCWQGHGQCPRHASVSDTGIERPGRAFRKKWSCQRWDVQRPPCLPTSAANVGTRGGGGGPTFAPEPEAQRPGGKRGHRTSHLPTLTLPLKVPWQGATLPIHPALTMRHLVLFLRDSMGTSVVARFVARPASSPQGADAGATGRAQGIHTTQ